MTPKCRCSIKGKLNHRRRLPLGSLTSAQRDDDFSVRGPVSAYRRMRGSSHRAGMIRQPPLAREMWTQRPRRLITPQSPQPRTTRGPPYEKFHPITLACSSSVAMPMR